MAMGESSSDDTPQPDETIERHADPPSPDPSVLESVLRQTLAKHDEPLSAAQLDALRSLARSHSGKPFALDPQGVELVAALLNEQFAASSISVAVMADVSREVATSLSEVPDVWRRLEELWRNLGGTPS